MKVKGIWPASIKNSFCCLEAELPKATSTSALSGAGMLRLFNKVGETVNKITYRMDESDPVRIYTPYKSHCYNQGRLRLCWAHSNLGGLFGLEGERINSITIHISIEFNKSENNTRLYNEKSLLYPTIVFSTGPSEKGGPEHVPRVPKG